MKEYLTVPKCGEGCGGFTNVGAVCCCIDRGGVTRSHA